MPKQYLPLDEGFKLNHLKVKDSLMLRNMKNRCDDLKNVILTNIFWLDLIIGMKNYENCRPIDFSSFSKVSNMNLNQTKHGKGHGFGRAFDNVWEKSSSYYTRLSLFSK